MPDYVNTVPGGQIGTGNAQVFGVNPLASQFASQLQNLRREEALQAQQLAKAWRDNQLAASSGRLWASDMAGIEKNFIDRGIDLQKKESILTVLLRKHWNTNATNVTWRHSRATVNR